jgi:hypothetical protein
MPGDAKYFWDLLGFGIGADAWPAIVSAYGGRATEHCHYSIEVSKRQPQPKKVSNGRIPLCPQRCIHLTSALLKVRANN